jgi:hypothetical protein
MCIQIGKVPSTFVRISFVFGVLASVAISKNHEPGEDNYAGSMCFWTLGIVD